MADYRKMYAIVCAAIDREIDALERIPSARASAEALRTALLEAEEICIETSICSEVTE